MTNLGLKPDDVFVFILAAFLGFQLIKRVSPLLHSPLMSLTNAIAAVVIVGAITVAGEEGATPFAKVLGFVAVLAATINLVSGFLRPDRGMVLLRARTLNQRDEVRQTLAAKLVMFRR